MEVAEEVSAEWGTKGPLRALGVTVISEPAVPEVYYPEEKLLTQLFLIKSNLSIYALLRELLIQAFSCSPFYIIYNK